MDQRPFPRSIRQEFHVLKARRNSRNSHQKLKIGQLKLQVKSQKKKRTLSEEETSNLENHNFNYVHHFFGEGLGWVYFEGYVFPGSCWSSKPILVSFWAREYRKFHYFQTVAYLEQKSTEKLDIVCASLSEQFRISKTMLPDLVCTYVCIYIYTLINMYIINSYNKCIT